MSTSRPGLFSTTPNEVPSVPEQHQQEFQQFRDTISELPADARKELMQAGIEIFNNHSDIIDCFDDRPDELITLIANNLATSKPQPDEHKTSSYLSTALSMIQTYNPLSTSDIVAFSHLLSPALGYLLIGTAMAQDISNCQVFPGAPKHLYSLCQGISLCIEGFATDNDNNVLGRFTRTLKNEEGGTVGTQLHLEECFNIERLQSIMCDIYSQVAAQPANSTPSAPGNYSGICEEDVSAWEGWKQTGFATNLPYNACNAFKDGFEAHARQCEDINGVAKYNWIITGGVLGGTAVLALLTWASYKAAHAMKKADCCKPS